MDPIDPSQIPLRDIHLPDAISWWPLASGWWLILVFLIVCALLVWFYLRRDKTNHQRLLLQSLQNIEDDFNADGDNHRLAKRLSMLARQITLLQQNEHASEQRALIGDAWTDTWQARLVGDAITQDELHRALNVAPYREQEDINGEKLIAAFKQSISQTLTANRKRAA